MTYLSNKADSGIATSIVINTTTITGGTIGSVLFIGAGTTVSQDNANFFWDDTNNRLGIGTNVPTATISIGGNGALANGINFIDHTGMGLFDNGGLFNFGTLNHYWIINGSGHLYNAGTTESIGVGTSTPVSRIEVKQNGAGAQQIFTLSDYTAAAAGIGTELDFNGSLTLNGSSVRVGYIQGLWVDGSGNGKLVFGTRNAGTPTDWLTIGATGAITVVDGGIYGANGISIRTNASGNGWQMLTGGGWASVGSDGPVLSKGTTGLVYTHTLAATSGIAFPSTTSMSLRVNNLVGMRFASTTLIDIYGNISTAGWGVPAIYGSGSAAAQTAAVASVATYTVGAADGTFEVTANVNVTTATAHAFGVVITYTDETNTSRSLTLPMAQLAGTFVASITNVTGVGPYEGAKVCIRCKASTAITITTAGTFTTVTYNVYGSINQIA